MSSVERVDGHVREQLDELTHLDKSILTKAFRGALVPQDPTDEPASVLLARIRAERSTEPTRRTRQPKTPEPPTPPQEPTPPQPPGPARPSEQLSLLAASDLQVSPPIHAPPERVPESEEPTEVMALLRTILKTGTHPREQVMRTVAEGLGYRRLSAKLRKRLDGHLLAAVRRGILVAGSPAELSLATRRLVDYDRDALVANLRAVTRRGGRYDRDELARALLDHLGFRRMSPAARQAIDEAIRAALRDGSFETVEPGELRRV